jgi:uncharacterized protein
MPIDHPVVTAPPVDVAADRSNTFTSTPVTFANRAGLRLFGILETPLHAVTRDLAVILLSPGVKMRVGPECLYRAMAKRFVACGLPVLRFDFHGLGDSEGELREEQLRDVYNQVQVGRFVDDVYDTMDWMQRTQGTKRFILSGLCGGAITGLFAGRDPRVIGLLSLGIPTVLTGGAADASRYMTRGEIGRVRGRYLRRLLSPQAWMRFLTFKADNRLIRRLIVETFYKKAPAPVAATPQAEADDTNPLLAPAFFHMLDTKRPMLLVFGGNDRLQFEFEEKFTARHRERLAQSPPLYDVHVVKDANHVLSTREWQADMLDASDGWLRKHFARDLARA